MRVAKIFFICILLLSTFSSFSQEDNTNYQRNFKAIGFKIIYPWANGNIESSNTPLLNKKNIILLSHDINPGYELNYSYRKKYSTLQIDATEIEIGVRTFSGRVEYKRQDGLTGYDNVQYESKIDLAFQSVFFGSHIKFEKELNKNGNFLLLAGGDIYLRMHNNKTVLTDTYRVDYSPTRAQEENVSSFRDYREESVPVQSSFKIGFTHRVMINNRLISFEILGRFPVLNLHNAGNLKTNDISFAIRKELF